VTGNNVVSWSPGINDWYETVKLNYGVDYPSRPALFPRPGSPPPHTGHLAENGRNHRLLAVHGRGTASARHVPHGPGRIWTWAIGCGPLAPAGCWFMAEAYNNDPGQTARSAARQCHVPLLNAGFNAVYDDPSYKALRPSMTAPGGPMTSTPPSPPISSTRTACATPKTTTKSASPANTMGRRRHGSGPARPAIL